MLFHFSSSLSQINPSYTEMLIEEKSPYTKFFSSSIRATTNDFLLFRKNTIKISFSFPALVLHSPKEYFLHHFKKRQHTLFLSHIITWDLLSYLYF